jgi:hypothetical protein
MRADLPASEASFGNDTTDILLRNANSGGFEVYDISNNNITNAAFLGNVGLDWQVMGFGNFSSRGETDLILRNAALIFGHVGRRDECHRRDVHRSWTDGSVIIAERSMSSDLNLGLIDLAP